PNIFGEFSPLHPTNSLGMKVLMVDDSPRDRKLYGLHLQEMFSLEFTEAGNAATALELCRTAPPDCVLLDYRLPDANGMEFLRSVRGDGEVPEFAVIMLTGLADEQLALDALKAGAQDYLVKDRI